MRFAIFTTILAAFVSLALAQPLPAPMAASIAAVEKELAAKLDDRGRERLHRGLLQAARLWRVEDGSPDDFARVARQHFASDAGALDALFGRFETNLELVDGHLHALAMDLRRPVDLDLGPMIPLDPLFAGYDTTAHVVDDFFANKLAFAALLNFPLTTLAEREAQGSRWSRRQWAEARLASRFSKRIPAAVQAEIGRAVSDAELYVARYNLWMHHVLDEDGQRLFAPGTRLLSHWNLRDEIRAGYSDSASGLRKQRLIARAMERIVDQTIPASVVDNPALDWNPRTNAVSKSPVDDAARAASRPDPRPDAAADTRYETLLAVFRAVRKADPFTPATPTFIARRFDENYEMPAARVRSILEQVVSSPLVPRVARLVQKRLGRPLETFDIWYPGFRERDPIPEARLDETVRARYPNAKAYEDDIPRLMRALGFDESQTQFLASNIVVDPARGSGHAAGGAMRTEKAHLRTRIGQNGMDYKGYNIAIHEMGHNAEQSFSLNRIDHTLLGGVPSAAFTEALAFVFQARDLELLGVADAKRDVGMKTLNDFWATYEIAGVSLVDMQVWEWLYAHPDATAAELRDATLSIAKDVWNKGYAPVFGRRDATLLAIYSHMLDYPLYLAGYPLGHIIAFQIEERMHDAASFGKEFERVSRIGRVTPDEWMRQATGRPVSAEALLAATRKALDRLEAP